MKVTIADLIRYDWNHVMLWGKKDDPTTWRWDKEKKYTKEECLASAQDILESSTPYETLVWEMEHEEGEEGYKEECEMREDGETEEYEIILPHVQK